MKKTSLSYCGDLVRSAEPDLFLLSMFLPANIREHVWALMAFHHEISKTRDVVSESTLGLIRLQWWRDSIGEIYTGQKIQGHEVLKPLADAIQCYDLPQESFDKLIYAREFDLENVSPGNIEGLMNYCDFTTAPLFELIVRVTGDDPTQHIIQPIAINYTLIRVLRMTPHLAKTGRLMLPEDVCMKNGITVENIFEKKEKLPAVIEEIFQKRMDKVQVDHVFLKGAQAASDIYLKHLESCQFDVFAAKMKIDPPFKELRLFCKTKLL